jgi:hypothetical protein
MHPPARTSAAFTHDEEHTVTTAILESPAVARAPSTPDPCPQTFVVIASGLDKWARGDVITAETFRQALKLTADAASSELQRLLVGNALRLATPDESQQSRVSLAGTVDRHVSLESLLASKEAELTRAKARISELESLAAMNRQQQVSLPAANAGQAFLLEEKDRQIAALGSQLGELRRELTKALAAQSVANQPAQPVTFTPAPAPAVSSPEVSTAIDPTIPPPPARSAESKAAEARVSRRGN